MALRVITASGPQAVFAPQRHTAQVQCSPDSVPYFEPKAFSFLPGIKLSGTISILAGAISVSAGANCPQCPHLKTPVHVNIVFYRITLTVSVFY